MGCGASAKKYQEETPAPPQVKCSVEFLSQVPLFRSLPDGQKEVLASHCETQDFQAGQLVIRQGDLGDRFFIIRSGQGSVSIAQKDGPAHVVGQMKQGDCFGERALLHDDLRTATIIADSELSTFTISREKFMELGLHEKLSFPRRKAIGREAKRELRVQAPSKKTDDERKLITEALRNNENINVMVTLDATRIDALIDICWKERVTSGKTLIQEGDVVADYFYVIQEGNFEVLQASPQQKKKKGYNKSLRTLGPGESFGERALLCVTPRTTTVKATSNAVVWIFDRRSFKDILMSVSKTKIEDYCNYLDKVEILTSLRHDEKQALAHAMVELHFGVGETILQQGTPGNSFYIVFDGEVAVIEDSVEKVKLKASVADGTTFSFGDRSLINNEARTATVKAVSEVVKALVLDRDSFNLLLGPLEDILKQNVPEDQVSKSRVRNQTLPKGRGGDMRERIKLGDLQRVGLLGCGGFGFVDLYESKKDESYAVKAISKGFIVKSGMQENVMSEKNIMLMLDSPFIIKLYETYNDPQFLFFLMELALGGELYETYNRKALWGSAPHAKFYTAAVICAFEHMHENHLIYRDLKPENVLLNGTGQAKITDMGLAKYVIGKTYTTCGTPDYFAPEVIAAMGYNNAVDWWTLGVLTFELIVGYPPFQTDNVMGTCKKICKGLDKVTLPVATKGPVASIIRNLLHPDPSERCPMRPGGSANLRQHTWYNGFDWVKFCNLRMEPPYKPVIKGKSDIANFNASPDDLPERVQYVDDGSGWDADFATSM